MIKAGRSSLLMIGALLSIAGVADDDASSGTKVTELPPQSFEKLIEESTYAERWRFRPPVAPVAHATDERRPIVEVEFQESSGLASISRQRSLTFLNLTNSAKARLFVGVNEDGLVGLHYRAVSRHDDSDAADLALAPNIREPATDAAK